MTPAEKLTLKMALVLMGRRIVQLQKQLANTSDLGLAARLQNEIRSSTEKLALMKQAYDQGNVAQMQADIQTFLDQDLF